MVREMKRVILVLAFLMVGVGVGFGQNPVVRAPGGSGAGVCVPSYTSSTVIGIGACSFGVGNSPSATVAACSTSAVPSGTGTLYVYIQDDNTPIFGYSGTNTTGCGAWVIEQNVTGFPDSSFPIATFTWTGGAWSSTVTDQRRLIRRDAYLFNDGLSQSTLLGTTLVTNDNSPAVAQAGTVRKVVDTSSSTTTYTGCPTPTLSTLSAGMFVWFKPANNNTASSTLNLCSLGATTIQKMSSGTLTNLSAGDLDSDTYYLLTYNGTVFVLVPMQGGGSSVTKVAQSVPFVLGTFSSSVAGTNCVLSSGAVMSADYSAAYSISFPDSGTPTIECTIQVPEDWDGGVVKFNLAMFGNTVGSGNKVELQVATDCPADGGFAPSYGGSVDMDLTSLTAASLKTQALTSYTLDAGCAENRQLSIRVQRNTGSADDDYAAAWNIITGYVVFLVNLQ